MKFQMMPLSKLGKIVSGSTPSTTRREYWDGNIPWVTPADLTNNAGVYFDGKPRMITKAGYDSCSTTMLPVGSILFSSRAPIGHCAVTTYPLCTNQGFKNIVPNDLLDSIYGYYALRYFTPQLIAKGRGATFSEINAEIIREFCIPLPSRDEQKRIAAILEEADHARCTRRFSQAISDTFLQEVFVEMFGDPVTNPMRWDVCNLGKLVRSLDSRRIPLEMSERAARQGPYPYYGATGIIDYIDDFLFAGENLLVTEDRKSLRHRNRPLAFKATGKYWVNNHAHVLAMLDKVNIDFLCQYINLFDIDSYVTGIDQYKLTANNLSQIPVLLPEKTLQEDFANIVGEHERVNRQQQESVRQAEHLFQTLLHRAFRGEL